MSVKKKPHTLRAVLKYQPRSICWYFPLHAHPHQDHFLWITTTTNNYLIIFLSWLANSIWIPSTTSLVTVKMVLIGVLNAKLRLQGDRIFGDTFKSVSESRLHSFADIPPTIEQTYGVPLWNAKYAMRSTVPSIAFSYNVSVRLLIVSPSICRDSLQNHVTTSHSPTWNVSHEKPQQSIIIPQDILSSANPHSSPFATVSPANYGPFSSQNTNTGQYSTLASPAPARAFQVPNFGALSLDSPNGSSTAVPRSTSSLTSDRRIATLGSPPRPHPFSHRRSSTSSSSIVSYLPFKDIYF